MSLQSFLKASNLFLEIIQDEKVQELAKGTWHGLQRLGTMAGEPTQLRDRRQRVPFAPVDQRRHLKPPQSHRVP